MPILDKTYAAQSSANNAGVKTRSPLAAAMVWLTTHLIEGFAACGQAMYPHAGYVQTGELLDDRGPDIEQQRWNATQVVWVYADNPWVQQHLLRPAPEAQLLVTPETRDN
jgi:hypothetical protein